MNDVWQRHRWKIIAGVVLVLAIGARWEVTQGMEAEILTLGVPLGALVLGLLSMRDTSLGLRRAAGITALVALVGAELLLGRAFFPPEPLAKVSLSLEQPDAVLELPSSASSFDVETQGALGHAARGAEERFVLDLERAGTRRTLEGTFSKSAAARFTRRRAPTAVSSHTIDVDRQPVDLPGAGPAHAHLTSLTGSGAKHVELRLFPGLPGGRSIELAFAILVGIGLALQIGAARQGARARFLPWLGVAVVLALYLPRHFSPSDPLGALIGAAFVTAVVGGMGGLALASLAQALAGRRRSA